MGATIFDLAVEGVEGSVIAYPCVVSNSERLLLIKACIVPWEGKVPISIGSFDAVISSISFTPLLRALFTAFSTAELIALLEVDTREVLVATWRRELVLFRRQAAVQRPKPVFKRGVKSCKD